MKEDKPGRARLQSCHKGHQDSCGSSRCGPDTLPSCPMSRKCAETWGIQTASGEPRRIPALLSSELFDHSHLAVGDPKTETLGVALRGCAALRDHDGVLASGLKSGGHSGTQQRSLQAASSIVSKRAGAAKR